MGALTQIVGQDAAVAALQRALEADCLAGAYLFVGPDGVGKGALSAAFAQAAACLSPAQQPFDACGRCDSCRRAASGAQPEIITIAPAGEALQIWQLWDRDGRAPGALSRGLAYAPSVGRRRIYILEDADRLTEQAANSLLKVLEEPPSYAFFILLAGHPARVLPTIVSRSHVVRVHAVPRDALAGFLHEQHDLDAETAAMIAAYSEGRVGQAVEMARSPTVTAEIGRILDFAATLPCASPHRALRVSEELRKLAQQTKALAGDESTVETAEPAADPAGGAAPRQRAARRQLAAVFDLLVAYYHDLLAASVGSDEGIVNRSRAAEVRRLAAGGVPERWRRCLDALLLARRRLDANASVDLLLDVLAVRLTEG